MSTNKKLFSQAFIAKRQSCQDVNRILPMQANRLEEELFEETDSSGSDDSSDVSFRAPATGAVVSSGLVLNGYRNRRG